jgi:signal transduction histidine kinase
MKFWQKAFLGILAVFIVMINVCLYMTSEYSFALNLDRDRERALGEYNVIMNGVYTSMNSLSYRDKDAPDETSLVSLMRSYADYYLKQGVSFELKHTGRVVFTNIPSGADASGDAPSEDVYNVRPVSGSETNYLCITGRVGGQFRDYTLVYLRDMSQLYKTHAQLTRYLLLVSGAAEILLALVLLALLKKLTKPIGVLQKATRRIAGGDYGERIHIRGRDELHDLSENFNQMAGSIQEKITALDRNAQDKQMLIDNLAHELRTPLTAIRGWAEYLRSASMSEEARIDAAGTIISEADRMQNLAFKLLDLALVRNNRTEFTELKPLRTFLAQLEEINRPVLAEKGVTLELSCGLKKLTADPVLLLSLLSNLISNAARASDPGSTIMLSAYCDLVPVLEVRDSGCGMTEEQVSLVCEPFYRADKARSRSSGGVGLGMSLVSEIVRLHGAELKIDSEPGRGTVIRVFFTTSLQVPENSEIKSDV